MLIPGVQCLQHSPVKRWREKKRTRGATFSAQALAIFSDCIFLSLFFFSRCFLFDSSFPCFFLVMVTR